MGHYVSFWGMVKGRDVDCGTSEYAKIIFDVTGQLEEHKMRLSELTVMVGDSGKGIIQTTDGKRFFYGSKFGLIELPEGTLCPHRQTLEYHVCEEISCPICEHGGIRYAWHKLGWMER
jgi:hypothetical protein